MTEPKRLGKYEILEEIGRGGFAVVYRAHDTELDRVVALKVLHPQLTTDPKFIQRFYQEARTAAGLRHPHIVTIHDVGEEAGQHYLAMAFLPGRTLDKRLAEGPLPVEEAISIVEQVGNALDAIHEQGLVHRDVKPGNITVDDAGQATLLDFGIVRAAEGTRLTTTMAVLGTPEYMAPEQAEIDEAVEVDWRADVYALGVVAYEMLAGRPPFTGKPPTAVLYKHVHEEPPSPLEFVPDVGDDLSAMLLRALAKPPTERYPSAGAFVAALREAVDRRVTAAEQETTLEQLEIQARELLDAGEWLEALNCCTQMMRLDRDWPAALEMWTAAQEGLDRQRAEAAMRHRLEERYTAGLRLMGEGKWKQAITALEEVAKGDPDFQDTRGKLAQVRGELQRARWYDEAIAHGETEHWAEACRVWVNVLRGRLDYRDGDAALRLLDAVGELLSQYDALGKQLAQQPDLNQVREALALYDVLAAAIDAQDWKHAVTVSEELLALEPNLNHAQVWLSRAHEELADSTVWEKDGKEMGRVPAGAFLYGDENSEIELPEFWIDRTPVTNAEYGKFVAATGHRPPRHWPVDAPPKEIADHPVVNVSWREAAAYAAWAGKRLPSEEEWEKAARGTDGREYPWGEWELGRCNSAELGIQGTTPVGQYSPGGDSTYGCADMAGNVWEWTASGFETRGRFETRYKSEKIQRGGSWRENGGGVRAVSRLSRAPGDRLVSVGFRCAAQRGG